MTGTTLEFDAAEDTGTNDFVLQESGGRLQLLLNGNVVANPLVSDVSGVVLNGTPSQTETLTVDFGAGAGFVLSDGISLNGGSGIGDRTGDVLIVRGTSGDDTVLLSGNTISFTSPAGTTLITLADLEGLEIDVTGDGTDAVQIDQPIVVSGLTPSVDVAGGGTGTDTLTVNTEGTAGTQPHVVRIDDGSILTLDTSIGPDVLQFVESIEDGDNLGNIRIDGLNQATSVAEVLNPDGSSYLYVSSSGDDAITVFGRSVSGEIRPVETIRNGEIQGSETVAGLVGANYVTTDADGRNVYVASTGGSEVAVFERNAVTGRLTFVQALVNNAGTDEDGLGGIRALAVSPDGRHVYTAGRGESRIGIYSRDTDTGELTLLTALGDSTVQGFSGLDFVAISADGNFVYTAAVNADAVLAFQRDADTGLLTQIDIERDGNMGADGLTPDGLDGVTFVLLSPDGQHLYAAGFSEDKIAIFSRAMDGTLMFAGTVTDEVDGVDGLNGVNSISQDPTGSFIYASGFFDDAVAVFSRDSMTGELAFIEVLTDNNSGGPVNLGTEQITRVLVSADGTAVYTTSLDENALSVFERNTSTGRLTSPPDIFRRFNRFGGVTVDGLDGAKTVAISPDDKFVYVTGTRDDSVAVFRRNSGTGALDFVQEISDRQVQGVLTVDGLRGADRIVISPDGNHVYVTGKSDDGIAVFSRNAATGELTFLQVIRDSAFGNVGLDGPEPIAISPDGAFVYVGAQESDNSLTVFSRNAVTGNLTFLQLIRNSGNGGTIDGLAEPEAILAIGDYVYVGTSIDDTLLVFRRNAAGILSLVEVFQDDSQMGTASAVAGATFVNGLERISALTASADGRHVYVVSRGADNSVTVFNRNANNGELTLIESIFDGGGASDLAEPTGVAVSPDGRFVLVTSFFDDSLTVFGRDAATGRLTQLEVEQNIPGALDALTNSRSVAISADGRHVYTAASQGSDNAVAVFRTPAAAIGYSSIDTLNVNTHGGDDEITLLLSGMLPPSINFDAGSAPAADTVIIAGTPGDDIIEFEGSTNVLSFGALTVSLGGTEELIVLGFEGDDQFSVTASTDISVDIDGGPHVSGDTLQYIPQGGTVTVTPGSIGAGSITETGFSTSVEYQNIETVLLVPVVTLPGPGPTFTEGGPAVLIDPAATVTDADFVDPCEAVGDSDAQLTVTITANGTANDRLAIRNEGNGAGQIGFNASTGDVSFGGTLIGNATGGTDGTTPLIVDFNTAVTPAAMQALLRNITFENVSEAPSTLDRIAQVVATDIDGASSRPVFKTIRVVAVNDVPVLALPGMAPTFTEGMPPVIVDTLAMVNDIDSPDFDGGQLAVSITANGTADDRLSIRNEGNGAGRIGFNPANRNVSFGGILIGSAAGGTDGATPLIVSFNSSATPAAAQALLRNVFFENVSVDPSTLDRTVQAVVTDGDGGTSNIAVQTVQLTAVNNPPTVTVNGPLALDQGGSALIAPALLQSADADDGPAGRIFTVDVLPANGTLQLGGVVLGAGDAFTQDDVDNSRVSYVHDDSDTTTDRFFFTLTDAAGAVDPNDRRSFEISVLPTFDPADFSIFTLQTSAGGPLFPPPDGTFRLAAQYLAESNPIPTGVLEDSFDEDAERSSDFDEQRRLDITMDSAPIIPPDVDPPPTPKELNKEDQDDTQSAWSGWLDPERAQAAAERRFLELVLGIARHTEVGSDDAGGSESSTPRNWSDEFFNSREPLEFLDSTAGDEPHIGTESNR